MTQQLPDLRIEVGGPSGVTINPDLWGIFFEDINTSLDGGLNAELIRNGDFEFSQFDRADWGPLTGWHSVGEGQVEVGGEAPVHPNNRHYLRLTGPITLTNEGWDPIRVSSGQRLQLSFATWGVIGGSITATIRAEQGLGGVVAETELPVADGGWNWQTAELVADSDGVGVFQLEVPNGVIVEVDVLSLRPTGVDGQPLTFRPDLVAALRGLNPSFVRFPGGCVAHGLGLENMYNWKDSIGARSTRKQLVNTWGYHQSRQVGYLEYFELCQELGATPLPVVAAGVCCQNLRGRAASVPLEQMPQYVQDILDLVEFANGSGDTTWGAYRAELGHPEPFGMRYLGIGNEDEITEDFRIRYAMIAEVVAERFPEITIIGTVGPQPFGADFEDGWAYANEQRIAIVDEHAYRTPRWFHQNGDRYDTYDRDAPAVYFGEYAARTNRVRSALAEAAFMIGMERNSDIVHLASYAPLFGKIDGTQWVPDLIYFDADRVLPSTSYQVHALFGQQRGGAVLTTTLEGVEPIPVAAMTAGNFRVRSGGASFDLREIQVDGQPQQDVHTDHDGHEVVLGSFDLGVAENSTSVLSFVASKERGTEGLVIAVGGTGKQSYLEVDLGSWQNKATVVHSYADGISNDIDGPTQWRGTRVGQDNAVRLELTVNELRVYLDGELRHRAQLDLRPEHRVAALVTASPDPSEPNMFVARVVNATDLGRSVTISLPEHFGNVAATLQILSGAGPDEGAAFEASPLVQSEIRVTGTGGQIQFDLPAWSFGSGYLQVRND